MEGGFFLSYYLTDTEDHYYYDQCQACSYRAGHGQCRTIVSDDGFQCYCSDGVYSTTACGTKRANWKTTIVVSLEKVVMEQFTKEGYTMISTLP